MAVKVTVYGQADMKQINDARADLDRLEKQAQTSAPGFAGALARMETGAKKLGNSLTSVGSTMTTHLTLPLAALGAGLYKATQAAAEDEAAQVALATSLRNTAGATDASVASVETWITKQGIAKGIADDELRPALATLATATHDVGKAQDLTNLAMDIAAAKHIPVATAANALAKAYDGNTTALKRMLPGIDEGALKSKNFGDIMKATSDIVGGQATAAANTHAGAQRKANVAMNEAIEGLGQSFLPLQTQVTQVLSTKVIPAINDLFTKFDNLDSGTKTNIVTVGLFVAALGPLTFATGKVISGIGRTASAMKTMYNAGVDGVGMLKDLHTGMTNANAGSSVFASGAMKVGGALRNAALAVAAFTATVWAKITAMAVSTGQWIANTVAMIAHKVAQVASTIATGAMTAAQWALNAAMSANPIMLVVIAVAALAAGITYLWQTNEGFRNSVITTWNAIKSAATTVWNWLVSAFQKWGGLIVSAILGPVGGMVLTLVQNWDKIKTGAKNAWDDVVSFFKEAPDRILSAIGNVGNLLYNVGKNIVDGLWNGISSGWNWLTNQVNDLVGNLVQAAKDALGIKSPSRVFAEIGANMNAGLRMGLLDSIGSVQDAVTKVATAATVTAGVATMLTYTAIPAAVSASPAPAFASRESASASSSRSVHIAPGAIQVHLNGSSDSDDVRKAVQEAFDNLVSELRAQ